MSLKIKTITLPVILFLISSCSTTPPVLVHEEYGEMLADNALFQKDASECALQAKQGVSGTTLNQNSENHDVTFAGIQLFSFFNENASCIKSKGWRIQE